MDLPVPCEVIASLTASIVEIIPFVAEEISSITLVASSILDCTFDAAS